jgi:Na+/melibiose symporter-like transporter
MRAFFCFVLFFCFLFFQDRVSLCSPGCPETHSVDQAGLELRNPPASDSQVLGLKACATTAWRGHLFKDCSFCWKKDKFVLFCFFVLFFFWGGGVKTGVTIAKQHGCL